MFKILLTPYSIWFLNFVAAGTDRSSTGVVIYILEGYINIYGNICPTTYMIIILFTNISKVAALAKPLY